MKPHQKRVVQEKKDLDEKSNELYEFIISDKFRELDQHEQLLLRDQYHFMRHYSWVLESRLEYWQQKEVENENMD